MMRKILWALLLSSLLVACGKGGPLAKSEKIRVRVTTGLTKGTVTTDYGLDVSGSFSMDAYVAEDYFDYSTNPATKYKVADYGHYISSVSGANVHQSGGEWVIDGEPFWIADTYMRFWAWHPSDAAGLVIEGKTTVEQYGADYLNFSYSAPDCDGVHDADNSIDLLFAYTKKLYDDDAGNADGNLNLTFQHALSQVRFCVSTDDGTFDTSLKIKNISISGLKKAGSAAFTDSGNGETNDKYGSAEGFEEFTWSPTGASFVFGQDYNADFSTIPAKGWTSGNYVKDKKTYDLQTCQNVFFMIPQKITDANIMTVTFVYNGEELSKQMAMAGDEGVDWLADHCYTYKLKATILGRDIDASVSLMGWSDRNDIIFI